MINFKKILKECGADQINDSTFKISNINTNMLFALNRITASGLFVDLKPAVNAHAQQIQNLSFIEIVITQ